MKNRSTGFTRRDFLRTAAGAASVGVWGLPAFAEEAKQQDNGQAEGETADQSKVVLIRDSKVLTEDGQLNAEVARRMLNESICALFGESEPKAAWKKVVKPDDVVGIKTNVWRFLRTPLELEEEIKNRIIEVGVPVASISVSDRGVRNDPVFQKSTALINIRPMRTHHWSGVGSCIKNYIPFAAHPPKYHPDACADLAALWELPEVKGKTRLNILVMLTPLYQGKGPHHFQQQYTWPYKGLIVGTDPVAVDATGLRILEAKRLEALGVAEPFAISPKHIRNAQEKFHLGFADPERISLEKIGWQEAILI